MRVDFKVQRASILDEAVDLVSSRALCGGRDQLPLASFVMSNVGFYLLLDFLGFDSCLHLEFNVLLAFVNT